MASVPRAPGPTDGPSTEDDLDPAPGTWKYRPDGPECQRWPALVVLWCRSEPGRVGEVLLPGEAGRSRPRVFGRHDAADTSTARLHFYRQRPGVNQDTGQLHTFTAVRVSRAQLSLYSTGHGLRVSNLRAARPLYHNGHPVIEAEVLPGDLLYLHHEILFWCTTRPHVLPLPTGLVAPGDGGWGGADVHGLVGESPATWEIRHQILRKAASNEDVLIIGPTGAGKELVARALHRASPRRAARFVPVNTPEIEETLFALRMYGREKNAVNHGEGAQEGYVREAGSGTLFLDELHRVPAANQHKLLRLLEDRSFRPGGTQRPVELKARVLGGVQAISEALIFDLPPRFRVHLDVPGLEARREDVPLLAQSVALPFKAALAGRPDSTVIEYGWESLDPLTVAALMVHPLKDNVRTVQRLVLECHSERPIFPLLPCRELREVWEAFLAQGVPGGGHAEHAGGPFDLAWSEILHQQRKAGYEPRRLEEGPAGVNRRTSWVRLRIAICRAFEACGWDAREALHLVAGAPTPSLRDWCEDGALVALRARVAEFIQNIEELAELGPEELERRRATLSRTYGAGAADVARMQRAVAARELRGLGWLKDPTGRAVTGGGGD